MTNDANQTTKTQRLLDRLAAGDDKAADELIEYAIERLRRLTRKYFRGEQAIRRWEETDDVLQGVLLRLRRAIISERPTTQRHFLNLAARKIRHELCDIARRHFGPEGERGHYRSEPRVEQDGEALKPLLEQQADAAPGPSTEHQQRETEEFRRMRLHMFVDSLPPDEREVFDLTVYDELEQAEVAEVLGISIPTVRRRWSKAQLLLGAKLESEERDLLVPRKEQQQSE